MARLGAIVKNNRRKKLSQKYEPIRKELRAKAVNLKLSDEVRAEAALRLQKLPRDGARIRVRNRCYLTGRARGCLRDFGLCRIAFRQLALLGKIPGVTKASW